MEARLKTYSALKKLELKANLMAKRDFASYGCKSTKN
jgi:hypothetical protein